MLEELKRRLAESVIRSRPDEAARVVEGLPPSVGASVIEALSPSRAVQLLRAMVPGVSGQVLAVLQEETARDVLLAMPTRSAAALIRRQSPEKSAELLKTIPAGRRRKVETLVAQRARTAGALADPDALVLGPRLTAGEALTRFRVELIHAAHALPVVDEDGRLVGLVEPRDLTSARKPQLIGDLMQKRFPRLPARTPLRSLGIDAAWQTHSTLPVVDSNGAFIGILSHETWRSALDDASGSTPAAPASTSEALGDLFGLGVGGMLEALVQPFGREPPK